MGRPGAMSAAPFGLSGHVARCKGQLFSTLFLSYCLSPRQTDDGVDTVALWRWVQLGWDLARTGLPWLRTRIDTVP